MDCPINPFPKIWHIGSKETEELFNGPVEVTEKIDGSQFSFGRIGTDLIMRSKGQQIYPETAEKMFKKVVDWAMSVKDKIAEGTIFYGEAITSPRHNTLSYEREPKGNFILFGVKLKNGDFLNDHKMLSLVADTIGCESVPLLYKGIVAERSQLDVLLETISVLGKEKIEGVVIKNYNQLAKSAYSRECFAKLVRPEFKERNSTNYPKAKDKMESFFSQFKTEARWKKAIQRLKERGELTQSPADIGKIVAEVHKDIKIEEESYVKEALYKMFERQVMASSTSGLPEYYKSLLVEGAFGGSTESPSLRQDGV